MHRSIYALALPAVALATPASAQEAATEFTGPRVEATIGWDQLRFDLDEVGSAGRQKVSDLGYGLAIGYDAALGGNLIGGLEAGLNFSDVAFTAGDAVDGGSLRKRRELTLSGRLGTAITPNTLLYGKVGYANLQVRQSLTSGGVTTDGLKQLDGVLIGAGAEVKVSPNVYLKSEYRYTNYQDGYSANSIMSGIGVRF